MKKFSIKKKLGGVLGLVILLLSLSLVFTACSDGGDDNSISDSSTTNPGGNSSGNEEGDNSNGNPSPTLPDNTGKNPVDEILGEDSSGNNEETDKTIRLSKNGNSDSMFELKNDGTATLYTDDKPYSEFKYKYNAKQKEIYMSMEKCTSFYTEFGITDNSLYTYDEQISQIKKATEKDNYINSLEKQYTESKDETWFTEQYPDCNNFATFLTTVIAQSGYDSFDKMLSAQQEKAINNVTRSFSVVITFGYEIGDDKKMSLTEKFTGVENLSPTSTVSSSKENKDTAYFTIYGCNTAIIGKGEPIYYSESFDKEKIVFLNPKNGERITATYTENVNNATVIATITDGEYKGVYHCTFEEAKYIRENDDNSSGNEDDVPPSNPSPELPKQEGTVDEIFGEDSSKESIRLNQKGRNQILVLNRDGTATYGYMDSETNEYIQRMEYEYTYNTDVSEISMRIKRNSTDLPGTSNSLYTFDELISKINEFFTIENQRKQLQEKFEKNKDTERFKEDYPDCDTYEKYENAVIKEFYNFTSFEDSVNHDKTLYLSITENNFKSLVTYNYKYENGALILTEKFTGIKNLEYDSVCSYENEADNISVYFANGFLGYTNGSSEYLSYSIDTNKKEIEFFETGDVYKKIKATYTEDIANGTATMIVDGKKYLCKFTGNTYTQE